MDVMRDKMDSMAKSKIREFNDLPLRHKLIRNKRIFKIKRRTDRSINKFKAHLVTKEFSQIKRVDYEYLFSCGENCLCSPTSGPSCLFEFRTIPNGCKVYFP